MAHCYDETRGGLERGGRLATAIAARIPARAAVLEVGVGTGAVARPLTDAGFAVCGVDISSPMLARAKERLGARVARADGSALPVRAGRVDAVVVVWVLHLVADVAAVLAECARVLRPGGRVVVVPGRGWYQRDDIAEALEALAAHSHPPADAPERLAELAPGAGLRLHEVGDCGLHRFEQSPADVARGLERRDFSWTWELDADTWERVAVPTIAALRSLPHPDRPRPRADRHALVVLMRR
ncbi:MAG: class I SAM-dependent methyltransferase [Acidimicrobiales bacterium]|nr:class I SAM-dependent methyltransferase [Acidimicrobiales bacterium]